jgi:hypothetical protein
MEQQISAFLMSKPHDEFWRAVEIAEELHISDLLSVKACLENGVDRGFYERKIVIKAKSAQVGYRTRRLTDIKNDEQSTSDDGEWERKST